jgi:DNA-binding SARP family transcriptional activator/tetratricopeptide (TPR) repeat protein
MGELRISLLGPFRASVGERPLEPFRTSKVQALLIYLTVEAIAEPEAQHPREALLDLLWASLPLKSAQDNLRQVLYQLRKSIPAQPVKDSRSDIAFVLSNRRSIGLNPEYRYSLDIADFLRDLDQGRLEEAAALYRGDFLADFYLGDSGEFEAWATSWRSNLRRHALSALNTLTERRLAQGVYIQAEQYASQQLLIDDLREGAYLQLMQALAGSGRRTAALEQFEICHRLLREELGINLSQEIKSLQSQIQAGLYPAEPFETDAALGKKAENGLRVVNGRSVIDDTTERIFVERKKELAQLAETLTKTCAGRGQLCFVIGGAGRGKTALVSEFARRAILSDPNLLIAAGYCHGQNGYGDLYTPFREILVQLTGGECGVLFSQEQARRLKLAMPVTIPAVVTQTPDLVDTLIPADALQKRAVSFSRLGSQWYQQLRAMVKAPYRENLGQDRLFSQVATYLKLIAAEHPLLIIIEDLHLADPSSVALLYHLSLEIGDSPIFLLGTYRPEEVGLYFGQENYPLTAVGGELKRKYGDIWLDLSLITEEEGRAFVDALLDAEQNGLDEAFRDALFRHTGGHALFTVELLRALEERGDLFLDGHGRWLAKETVDWQVLPARVEGVIEQRLSRLDPELHRALSTASVEGEVFTAEVVAQIQQLESRQLVSRLSSEVGRQHRLVEALPPGSANGRRISRYRFRHQLFQYYLYQHLDEVVLGYLHEEVGRALEDLSGPDGTERAARLAWHFERAGLAEKAIEYLIQAARQAVALGACDQVLPYCERGLSLLILLPDSVVKKEQELALNILQGNALIAIKGYGSAEALEAFQRAQELCFGSGENPQLSKVLFGLWGYFVHRADYQTARALANQAFNLARHHQELPPLLNAHRLLGVTLFYLGEFSSSLEHMAQVIQEYDPELHRELGFLYGSDPGISALSFTALNLIYMGYADQALAYGQKALQLARELSYPFALAFTLLIWMWLHMARDDLHAILEIVEEQIALTSEQGFPIQLAIAKYYKYWVRGLSGEAADSIPPIRRALDAWLATGARLGKSGLLFGLGQVCLEAGQIEEGLDHITEAVNHIGRTGERYLEPEVFRMRGELKTVLGAPAHEIEADFRQAIDAADQLGARLLELRATTALCRLWQEQGRKEEARQALANIYNWFSEGFDEPVLLEARKLLQELSCPETG